MPLSLTTAEISAWVAGFMWPFIRVSAMMLAAPLFGNASVPVNIRVLLAVGITVGIMPAVGAMPRLDPLSLEALLVGAQQALIGVALGLMIGMTLQVVVIAGESVALTMGLGFAAMVDPQTGVSTPVVSQFLLIVVTLLFLAVGGHLMLIQLTAESFTLMPVSSAGIGAEGFYRVVAWGSEMFAGAVLMALPALVLLLTLNMIIGVMTRAAPQMNIFSVGFPLTILVGMISLVLLLLPAMPGRMADLWQNAFLTLRQILGA